MSVGFWCTVACVASISAKVGASCHRKATGSLKYFHDKYNPKTQFAEHQKYVDTFEEAIQFNDQIRPHVSKVLLYHTCIHPLTAG